MLEPATPIGWIGYGRMGRPMCANLLKAGYPLSVYTRSQSKRADIAEAGARVATSPAELSGCDVIVSTVWDDAALSDVVLGRDGVLSIARPGLIFIDMSTVSVRGSAAVAEDLARRGVLYLRAPVSGSGPVAAAGELSIYVSGPKPTFDRCLPLFRVLGSKQTYVGEAEEARVFKLAINMLVQASSAILGEALSLGEKAGVDRSQLMDAINDSIVASDHYRLRAESIKRRDTTSPTPTSNFKDTGLALAMGAEVGAALPITALVHQYLAVLYASGKPVNAIVSLTTFLDKINGSGPGPARAG